MLPRNIPPAPLLSNLVQVYWAVKRTFSLECPFIVLPDSRGEWVMSLGAPLYTDEARTQPLGCSFLVGLLDKPISLYADGDVRLVAVRFFPWGIAPLLGESFAPLPDAIVSTEMPFLPLVEHLSQLPADDVESQVSAIEAFLLARMLAGALGDADLVAAAQRILASDGAIEMASLAQACAYSTRTLRRKFQRVLGKTPKSLARTVRFESVRDLLWENPDVDLADAALAVGYADQSHLQREFRHFSNTTPHRFAEVMRKCRAAIGSEDVQNLQDLADD